MILVSGILFGAIGTAYLIYGKRQFDGLFLIVGFALIIYPYLVSNVLLNFAIGLVLTLLPVARKKGWL